MSEVGVLLREARGAAGLGQAQLARLASTSQPAVSAYESGAQRPTTTTLVRLLDACGAELEVSIRHRTPTLARVVAQLVEHGEFDDEAFVLRWLLNQFARNDWAELTQQERVESLRRVPPSTGSRRWNAFVHALADYLAEQSDIARPDWLDVPSAAYEGELWYVGRGASASAARLVELDPARWFIARGVGLDAASLPA